MFIILITYISKVLQEGIINQNTFLRKKFER